MSAAALPPETAVPGPEPPRLSGGWPLLGHLLELRRRPIELFWRVRHECGEIGEMNFAGSRVVLLSGEPAHEAFFRAADEQLDQAAAYPFMTPIFGRGVVFDADPEQRRQAMKNQSLRDKMMRGHAETIVAETERMMDGLGEAGEIDLLDFFSELTLYTSSACLVGRSFRNELSAEYYRVFYELEKGTDALAYVNPDLPLPAFRQRDRARRRLVALLTEVFERRQARPDDGPRELFDILLSIRDEDGRPRYSIDIVTGMFISMMFAGHHTTSGTAAWTLIELLKHPDYLARVEAELDALFADGRDVSYQALREIPLLEAGVQEALRLHPPLILLMRKVMHPFHYGGHTVPAGKLVAVSPAVSNRMPECFPEPDRFDPTRYAEGREEHRRLFAWIPFGAGRHRCVGAAFAMMQLKAIFSHLLRHYEFELSQPHDTYRNDHTKMVVQMAQPCRARYRRRKPLRGEPMPAFPRQELEEMIAAFVAGNDEAGRTGDWSKMSRFYAEDAVYTWNNGVGWEFVAEGRQQIHDWVFGTEMEGLEQWTYPYVRTLIDDRKGEVIGIWRQVAPVKDPEGVPYEIAGTGGSWFRYGGDGKWAWQRDFFDHGNAGAVFGAMAKNQQLTPKMLERMKKGSNMPGWRKRAGFDWYAGIADPES